MKGIMGSGSLISLLRIEATSALLSDSSLNSTFWKTDTEVAGVCLRFFFRAKLRTSVWIRIKSELKPGAILGSDPPTASTRSRCSCPLLEWLSFAFVISICIWIVLPPPFLRLIERQQQDKYFGTAISFLLHNKHPYLLMFPFMRHKAQTSAATFISPSRKILHQYSPHRLAVFILSLFLYCCLFCPVSYLVCLSVLLFSSSGLLVVFKPWLDRGQRPSVPLTLKSVNKARLVCPTPGVCGESAQQTEGKGPRNETAWCIMSSVSICKIFTAHLSLWENVWMCFLLVMKEQGVISCQLSEETFRGGNRLLLLWSHLVFRIWRFFHAK